MVSNLVFVPIISVSFLLNKNKNKNKKTIKNNKTNKNKNKNNVQCLSQSTNHLRQKRFGTSQFMRNTPPLWLTEWALDLWTTTIRRCGLWRFHVHGWNIAKRSPRRRRSSTILCRDLSWRISTLAMTLNNVTSSVTCWGMIKGSRPDNEEALWQQGLWHVTKGCRRLPSRVHST